LSDPEGAHSNMAMPPFLLRVWVWVWVGGRVDDFTWGSTKVVVNTRRGGRGNHSSNKYCVVRKQTDEHRQPEPELAMLVPRRWK
jgi:hypothetical protein